MIQNRCKCLLDAKYYCSNCDVFICTECYIDHTHHILLLIKTILPNNKCKIHHKEYTNYYCIKCNIELCEKCFQIHNHSHKPILFFYYYETSKQKLYKFQKNLKSYIEKITSVISEEKRKNAYDQIESLLTYYLNAINVAHISKSFTILNSILKITKISLTQEFKRKIKYNRLPHLFMYPPLSKLKENINELYFTTKGNIFIDADSKYSLYNGALIKKEIHEIGNPYFMPDKKTIASVSEKEIKLYDIETLECKKRIDLSKYKFDDSYYFLLNNEIVFIPRIKKGIFAINLKHKKRKFLIFILLIIMMRIMR